MRAFRFLTPLCSVRNDSWSVFSQDGAQSYAKVSVSRNGVTLQPAETPGEAPTGARFVLRRQISTRASP